jgi:hypothetical protein
MTPGPDTIGARGVGTPTAVYRVHWVQAGTAHCGRRVAVVGAAGRRAAAVVGGGGPYRPAVAPGSDPAVLALRGSHRRLGVADRRPNAPPVGSGSPRSCRCWPGPNSSERTGSWCTAAGPGRRCRCCPSCGLHRLHPASGAGRRPRGWHPVSPRPCLPGLRSRGARADGGGDEHVGGRLTPTVGLAHPRHRPVRDGGLDLRRWSGPGHLAQRHSDGRRLGGGLRRRRAAGLQAGPAA